MLELYFIQTCGVQLLGVTASTEMIIPITLLFALLIVQQGTFSEFLALNCIAFEFNVPRTKSNIKPVKALISA